MTRRLSLLLALLLCAPLRADLPPIPSARGNVTDLAGVLSVEQTDALREQIARTAPRAGLAVAVIESAAPRSLKEWATDAFQAWGVGRSGRDDGLLVVLAIGDRRVEVEVGYGLEHLLPDWKVGTLLDTHAVPRFRQGRWGDGLVELVEALADELASAPAAALAPRSLRPPSTLSDALAIFGARPHVPLFLLALAAAVLSLLAGRLRVPLEEGQGVVVYPTREALGMRVAALCTGALALTLCEGSARIDDLYLPAEPLWVLACVLLMVGLVAWSVAQVLSQGCPECRPGLLRIQSRKTLREPDIYRPGLATLTLDCLACDFIHVSSTPLPARSLALRISWLATVVVCNVVAAVLATISMLLLFAITAGTAGAGVVAVALFVSVPVTLLLELLHWLGILHEGLLFASLYRLFWEGGSGGGGGSVSWSSGSSGSSTSSSSWSSSSSSSYSSSSWSSSSSSSYSSSSTSSFGGGSSGGGGAGRSF